MTAEATGATGEGVSLWVSEIETYCRANYKLVSESPKGPVEPQEEGDNVRVRANVYIGVIETHIYLDYPASLVVPSSDERAKVRLKVNGARFISLVGIEVAGRYYPVYSHR